MAWTLVGESAIDDVTATGDTYALPGTILEDDIVVVALSSDFRIDASDEGLIGGQGYTSLADNATNSPGFDVGYKVMGSTPDTTVDLAGDGGTGESCAVIQVWRGVDTSNPIDNSVDQSSGISGMPDPPSHTTVTAGCLRIITGHVDDDQVAASVTAPSGYSNVLAAEGGVSTVMIASKEDSSAGAEDPDAFGGTGDDSIKATHFALRPAVVPSSAATGRYLPILGVG